MNTYNCNWYSQLILIELELEYVWFKGVLNPQR
jgi:hypothetical protein